MSSIFASSCSLVDRWKSLSDQLTKFKKMIYLRSFPLMCTCTSLSEDVSALLSGLHFSPTRPPLQLGSACSPGHGHRRAESGSRLCQSKHPEETQERVHEQPSAAAEEPHPPAQSGGERTKDSALQAQKKNTDGCLKQIKSILINFLHESASVYMHGSSRLPWPMSNANMCFSTEPNQRNMSVDAIY